MSRCLSFLLVGALALALMDLGVAFAAADAGHAAEGGRSFAALLADHALVVVLVLVTPAFVLFVLRRRGAGPAAAWRHFWTWAWAVFVLRALLALPGQFGIEAPEGPGPDWWAWVAWAAALWWGLDVVRAWAGRGGRFERSARAALHAALFLGLAWASVFRGQGTVRGSGVVMFAVCLLAALGRVVYRPFDPDALTGRLYTAGFRAANRFLRWDAFPTWLAVVNLGALRVDLRAKNLHDTSAVPVTRPGAVDPPPPFEPKYYSEREGDGHFNDLGKPAMGRASRNTADSADGTHFDKSHPGARFGRNVPLAEAYPDEKNLGTPSPREVSNQLLARRVFLPAESLNLLAAAWIQFETHDWFNHGEPPAGGEIEVKLPPGDDWRECPMRVRRTRPDPTRDYDAERKGPGAPPPPTYANSESHWWDASQIYGSDARTTRFLRSGPDGAVVADGKLFVRDGHLARNPAELDTALSGFTGNWWAGLSLLHTLFAREHNSVCDRLRRHYPDWSGDQVFAVARGVNAALMAKIHTVEWTPAILAHPALEIAMSANWWGLMSERVTRLLGRLSENEAFSGIPGSGVDHHGADYCLTEEFVSVYRMHPLMPDALRVLSAGTGQELAAFEFPDGVLGPEGTLRVFGGGRTAADVLYSFGRAHPGAITLHNYPNYLRKLTRPDGQVVDLASIDVVRDRERGVPRYNRFRRLLRLKPVASFDDFRNPLHPGLGAELRAVYGTDEHGRDNVELLDLMVGMFAEVPPDGFGFSDTAFRVFILMASRRLKSDRFIAQDFTPEVYTPAGHAWVNENTMVSVLLRHYPELRPALRGVANAFKPWRDVAEGLPAGGWRESYTGGSPEAETVEVAAFARQIQVVQRRNAARARSGPRRGFHAKMHLGVTDAVFEVLPDAPEDLRVGPLRPSNPRRAAVRFSNASGAVRPDRGLLTEGKGIAIRVYCDDGEHDFLLSNSPVSHARDGRQFMAVALAASGWKALVLPKLVLSLGVAETWHALRILLHFARRPVPSLAGEIFWSRTPYAFGPTAVKFILRPESAPPGTIPGGPGASLREELAGRLRAGPLAFVLHAQRFVDAARTPIEDGTVEWPESVSPPVAVARLVIPARDPAAGVGPAMEEEVGRMAFNPWHTTGGVRPLGSLNRARKPVYEASAAARRCLPAGSSR